MVQQVTRTGREYSVERVGQEVASICVPGEVFAVSALIAIQIMQIVCKCLQVLALSISCNSLLAPQMPHVKHDSAVASTWQAGQLTH